MHLWRQALQSSAAWLLRPRHLTWPRHLTAVTR